MVDVVACREALGPDKQLLLWVQYSTGRVSSEAKGLHTVINTTAKYRGEQEALRDSFTARGVTVPTGSEDAP